MNPSVKFEEIDGGAVVRLTLARPERRNAMSAELMADLAAALKSCISNGARALVLAAEGPVFSAGADLSGLKHIEDEAERKRLLPAHLEKISQLTREALSLLNSTELPSVAAITGSAVGAGVMLPFSCDFRISVANATFWCPEVRYGRAGYLAPIKIMTAYLGPALSKRLLIAEEHLTAPTLAQYGAISQICEPEQVVAEATALARKIAGYDAATVRRLKSYIHQSAFPELDWTESFSQTS